MENTSKASAINILKGTTISIVCTLIFLLIFSAILTYTNISEGVIQPVIIIVTAISILIGSSIGSYKLSKNGIINGAIISGIYLSTIYIISSILLKKFNINFQTLIIIVTGMAFGIIGGIIGVNKK